MTGNDSGRRKAVAWLAWFLTIVVVLAFLVAVIRRVDTVEDGGKIRKALAKGDRPAAPEIPSTNLEGWEGPGTDDVPQRDVLVVNFWASWCGPCREETPMLQSFYEDRRGDGVTVVGVNPKGEDTTADARSFLKKFEVTYPIVVATLSQRDAWSVNGFPETYIVGRDGRISARIDGPVDRDALARLVDIELDR